MIVLAQESCRIKAAPEKVWMKLIDYGRWPEWDSAIQWVRLNHAIVQGSKGSLKVKRLLWPAPFTITEVEHGRNYTSVAKFVNLSMIFSHWMKPDHGMIELKFTISIAGWGESLYSRLFGAQTRRDLPGRMNNFKTQLENS
jgi:hypothetical protein